METKTFSQSTFVRFSYFVCLIMGVIGALIWILQSQAFLSGFWSLPLGLFQFEITVLSLIFSLLGAFFFHRKYFWAATFINSILCSSFFSVSCTRDAKGVGVLSWNVAGSQPLTTMNKDKLPCLLNYASQWSSEYERKIMFLQEVQKQHEDDFEQALNMDCVWSHYLCERQDCNGLLVCSDKKWNITLERRRPYQAGQRYGFQQLELEDTKTSRKLNVLNIHLESLWRTLAKMPNIQPAESLWQMLRSNPDPKIIFRLLKVNAKTQRADIDQLFTLIKKFKDPTLIAGDFNSPPTLWFHRALRAQYHDAHEETGFGFGHTTSKMGVFQGRIDYLYISPELELTGNTTVDNETRCSDHFPVLSSFSFGD